MARRPRTLGAAIGLSIVAWGASLLAVAAAGQSIGLELTIGEAALLASGVALATAIPSAPGYLGTFELAFVTIGQALGLPSDEAFALGFIVHVAILLLTSIGGAIAFLRLGWQRSADEVGEVARGMVDGDAPTEVALEPAPAGPAEPVSEHSAPGPSNHAGEAADIAALADPTAWRRPPRDSSPASASASSTATRRPPPAALSSWSRSGRARASATSTPRSCPTGRPAGVVGARPRSIGRSRSRPSSPSRGGGSGSWTGSRSTTGS